MYVILSHRQGSRDYVSALFLTAVSYWAEARSVRVEPSSILNQVFQQQRMGQKMIFKYIFGR